MALPGCETPRTTSSPVKRGQLSLPNARPSLPKTSQEVPHGSPGSPGSPGIPHSHKLTDISGPPTEAGNTAGRPRALSLPPHPPPHHLGLLNQSGFSPGGDPRAGSWWLGTWERRGRPGLPERPCGSGHQRAPGPQRPGPVATGGDTGLAAAPGGHPVSFAPRGTGTHLSAWPCRALWSCSALRSFSCRGSGRGAPLKPLALGWRRLGAPGGSR